MIANFKKDTPGFVVDVEKSKLTGAEHFDNNGWPDLTDGWYQKNYTCLGLTGKTSKKLVRLSKVKGAERKEIGEIKDVLMHPNSGKVAYGVVSLDKYEGVGDKLTTVPWLLIRQSKKDTEGFVVNADKAKLQGATYFEPNAWSDYNDPVWNTRWYSYYGVDRYWYHPFIYQAPSLIESRIGRGWR